MGNSEAHQGTERDYSCQTCVRKISLWQMISLIARVCLLNNLQ